MSATHYEDSRFAGHNLIYVTGDERTVISSRHSANHWAELPEVILANCGGHCLSEKDSSERELS